MCAPIRVPKEDEPFYGPLIEEEEGAVVEPADANLDGIPEEHMQFVLDVLRGAIPPAEVIRHLAVIGGLDQDDDVEVRGEEVEEEVIEDEVGEEEEEVEELDEEEEEKDEEDDEEDEEEKEEEQEGDEYGQPEGKRRRLE